MPVTVLPPEKGTGHALGEIVQAYLRGKQLKRQREMQGRQLDIEEALAQSQQDIAQQKLGLQERGLGLQEKGLGIEKALGERGLALKERALGTEELGGLAGAEYDTARAAKARAMTTLLNRLAGGEGAGEGAGLMGSLEDYDVAMGPGGISLQPKAKIPSEAVKQISGYRNLINVAKDAKQLYDAKYSGPANKIVGGFREAIGWASPEEVAFRRKVKSFIRRAYHDSGKEINEEEMRRLEGMIPTLDLPQSSFLSAIQTFQQELEDSIATAVDTYERAGYRTSGFKDMQKKGKHTMEAMKEQTGNMVKMQSPDGETFMVPKDQVEDAKTHGWKAMK